MSRYGLAIDIDRCTGCNACVVACKSENYTRPGVSWIRIRVEEVGQYPRVSRSYTPELCVQCGEMPCAGVCPTGAIFKGEGGIVLIDSERCDCGARLCMDACPFEALSANDGRSAYFSEPLIPGEKDRYEAHRDGVMEKCTLCHGRVTAGLLPACVQTCPTRAMIFGDLDEPGGDLARLVSSGEAKPVKGQSEVDPSVYYLG